MAGLSERLVLSAGPPPALFVLRSSCGSATACCPWPGARVPSGPQCWAGGAEAEAWRTLIAAVLVFLKRPPGVRRAPSLEVSGTAEGPAGGLGRWCPWERVSQRGVWSHSPRLVPLEQVVLLPWWMGLSTQVLTAVLGPRLAAAGALGRPRGPEGSGRERELPGRHLVHLWGPAERLPPPLPLGHHRSLPGRPLCLAPAAGRGRRPSLLLSREKAASPRRAGTVGAGVRSARACLYLVKGRLPPHVSSPPLLWFQFHGFTGL